jgi:hypothetical protein
MELKKDQNGGKRQGNLEISRRFCSKYTGCFYGTVKVMLIPEFSKVVKLSAQFCLLRAQ